MSVHPDPVGVSPSGPVARAAAWARGDGDAADLGPFAGIDDATRLAADRRMADLIRTIDRELRLDAARALDAPIAEALLSAPPAGERLRRSGLLHDTALVNAIVGEIRLERLAAALPVAGGDPERPSLVARLTEDPRPAVAQAAVALLAADPAANRMAALTWRVAAVLGKTLPVDAQRVLAGAAGRRMEQPGTGPEAAAVALVAALAPAEADLSSLLLETLSDRRLELATALLARAGELSFATVRSLMVEPDGAGLWTLLYALFFDRAAIAAVEVALAAADPRRDLERFADDLDVLFATNPADAAAALAPLALPEPYRHALLELRR